MCDVQALNLGVLGPCLLDLEALTRSRGQLSAVFTVRGLLAICASVALGPVLDRVNHYLLVSVALHVDFIMYICVSHCTSLTTLLITLGPPTTLLITHGPPTTLLITLGPPTTLLITLGPPEFVNCGIGMGQSTHSSPFAVTIALRCERITSVV